MSEVKEQLDKQGTDISELSIPELESIGFKEFNLLNQLNAKIQSTQNNLMLINNKISELSK